MQDSGPSLSGLWSFSLFCVSEFDSESIEFMTLPVGGILSEHSEVEGDSEYTVMSCTVKAFWKSH